MKNTIAFLLITCTLFFMTCNPKSKQSDNPFESTTQLLVLQNDLLTFTISPDTGGRVASVLYKGKEILNTKRDKENFEWGSVIWPSPQSDWNWPPPPKMDQFAYTVKSQQPKKIILESVQNAYRGIQLIKHYELINANTIDIEYTFVNNSDSIVNTGIWEISRIPYQGQVYWKSGKKIEDQFTNLVQTDSTSYFGFSGHKEAGKIFIHSDGGWVSYHKDGVIFKKTFPIIPSEKIASGQAPIEIYFEPIRKFAEIEQHGAYGAIKPGAKASYKVRWEIYSE